MLIMIIVINCLVYLSKFVEMICLRILSNRQTKRVSIKCVRLTNHAMTCKTVELLRALCFLMKILSVEFRPLLIN
jgi:hypothetical protein